MRAQFLEALARPVEDLRVGVKKVEPYRQTLVLLQKADATMEIAERTVEALSLGLTLIEVASQGEEDESEASP